ncbi:MAG: DNA polymerase Y family protein [Thermoleophilia bacterium]|nr:DNA polymerase Y family protein [Thermoleophilia bacterium]
MIGCVSIPGFPLRAALRAQPEARERPAALAPEPGAQPLVGACTAAAEAAGVRPKMRLSEALATCPELVLVEHDPATAEDEWERVLRRLEDAGFSVESREPGCAYFETAGLERLAGGLDAVLHRALVAVGHAWEPRVGAATRRFTALAAASIAPPHGIVVIDDDESALFLEPLPLDLLALTPERRRELSDLGIRRIGELAGLPGASVADRLGPEGEEAWRIVSGAERGRVEGRRPPSELAEELEFPEAIGNELTLERALAALLDRLLARPERAGRIPRQVALAARLVGGGSWRRLLTLREPTAEPERLRIALRPRLAELVAPVVALRLELGELTESVGAQAEIVRPRGSRLRERLREGLRQARVGAGLDAVCSVVEVAPWSRIPESRAILVPRDD